MDALSRAQPLLLLSRRNKYALDTAQRCAVGPRRWTKASVARNAKEPPCPAGAIRV